MAQETKVGLVVGLGFIICFAMILANRSGADRIHPQMPYQLFSHPASPQASPTGIRPEESARRIAGGEPSQPPTENTATKRSAAPAPGESTSEHRPAAPPASGVLADPERFHRHRRPISKGAEVPDPLVADRAAEEEAVQCRLPGGGHAAGVPSSNGNVLVQAEVPSPQALRTNLEEGAPSQDLPSASGERQHVVGPGDTLYKIARRYYGTNAAEVVKVVYEANRSVLNSPNTMTVGCTLRLPLLEWASLQENTAVADARGHSSDVKEPTRGGKFRWYKVKKGDQLTTIARNQLGNAQRWQEIVALNKDICSNPRRLAAGVELRIPVDKLADAR